MLGMRTSYATNATENQFGPELRVPGTRKVGASDCSDAAASVSGYIRQHGTVALILSMQRQRDISCGRSLHCSLPRCEIRRYPLPKLSDNQVGDRLHAALEAVGIDEGETIRGNTALLAARQTLSLLEQGLLIAAERNSDYVSTVMNQPIVPPSE
jgi:hypothetical protein